MPSNYKNLKKTRWPSATETCRYVFSISAIMPIGLNRKRKNKSNKSGVRQGSLYKVSFKLVPIVFEVASNTT